MELRHVLAQHLTKFAEYFLMPGVILQIHLGLHLCSEDRQQHLALCYQASTSRNSAYYKNWENPLLPSDLHCYKINESYLL